MDRGEGEGDYGNRVSAVNIKTLIVYGIFK